MNYIDKSFLALTYELENLQEEEILKRIKGCYQQQSKELKKSLEDYFEKYPYWGSLNTEKKDYNHFELIASSLKKHLQDYIFLYDTLKDYKSKQTLFAILNNYYKFDFNTLDKVIDKCYPHYFDLDLIKVDKEEVLVDLGAYTGDTIYDYLYTFGLNSYKKIYAYEITPQIFAYLKSNLENYHNIILKNCAVLEKEQEVSILENMESISANRVGDGENKIKAVSLDDDINEKITLLKMDIEGSEQQAILGAKRHIKEDHPTLFISVYHNLEDLWKIPRMINDITDGYQFYLRYYGGNIYPTEVVLIAIYKEQTNLI